PAGAPPPPPPPPPPAPPRGFGRIIVTTSLAATKVEPAIGSAYMTAKGGAKHPVSCPAAPPAPRGTTPKLKPPALHDGEGRREAPDALPRARARGRGHHRQRHRPRLLRHQHRRRPRPRSRAAGGDRQGHPDAPRRLARRHQGAGPLPRLAGLGL